MSDGTKRVRASAASGDVARLLELLLATRCSGGNARAVVRANQWSWSGLRSMMKRRCRGPAGHRGAEIAPKLSSLVVSLALTVERRQVDVIVVRYRIVRVPPCAVEHPRRWRETRFASASRRLAFELRTVPLYRHRLGGRITFVSVRRRRRSSVSAVPIALARMARWRFSIRLRSAFESKARQIASPRRSIMVLTSPICQSEFCR